MKFFGTWCQRSPIFALVAITLFVANTAVALRVSKYSSRQPKTPFFRRSYRRLPEETSEDSTLPTSPKNFHTLNDPPTIHRTPNSKSTKVKNTKIKNTASNAHDLRRMVLDDKVHLRNVDISLDIHDLEVSELLNHEVIQLIRERFETKSKPGNRTDDQILALAMEGGGMRGSVTAGMAAAIASLELTDCFDKIYGSSAGSVIGAYMVSRQMCMDVYVDILPAAQRSFVCVKRMMVALAVTAVDLALSKVVDALGSSFSKTAKWPKPSSPGMNISFVLDGILDAQHGLRPLDVERLRENDKVQQLRVASSCVLQNGKLNATCFGTDEFFSDKHMVTTADGKRRGLFACLEASMTVPGATGPPVQLGRSQNNTTAYFDAFCFEPLPYRSAVSEGATHVLVLCSRPECFQPKSKPGVYELGVAPLYFRSHNEPEIGRFFENGGQQYIYAEDLLTLEEGRRAVSKEGNTQDGVFVPPPNILYGTELDETAEALITNRDGWKKAHLLPVKVPKGTPELGSLDQGKDEVLEAVRGGFAAAFDLLAPVSGIKLRDGLSGKDAAKIIFPDDSTMYDKVTQMKIEGNPKLSGDFPPAPISKMLAHISAKS